LWIKNQKAVTVTVTDVENNVEPCGIISDYNTYTEQPCEKSGNLVTLAREEPNV
jgi:hypothetical protein